LNTTLDKTALNYLPSAVEHGRRTNAVSVIVNHLVSTLKKLRLSGLASSLEVRLHEAATSGLTHREFLELLLQDELMLRSDRQISRRTALASFRDTKSLEDFDFSFIPSIKKSQVFELATCKFIRERRDVLWVGPPGTGKSHLCQALGLCAVRCGLTVYYRSIFDTVRDFLHDEAMEGHERILQRYLKPDLLIIDDMGMKQLPKDRLNNKCQEIWGIAA
jgi:DNA replication protein DnaC